jgi:hypothetical protein
LVSSSAWSQAPDEAEQLCKGASVEACATRLSDLWRKRPASGVKIEGVPVESAPGTMAYTVARVTPGSPEALAGVREGDLVVAVDGRQLADFSLEDFRRRGREAVVGEVATWKLSREGGELEVRFERVAGDGQWVARKVASDLARVFGSEEAEAWYQQQGDPVTADATATAP